MKKSFRRDHPSEPSSRNRRDSRHTHFEGRWEFATGSSLIALGSTDAVRRAAYRTPDGEVRFLQL